MFFKEALDKVSAKYISEQGLYFKSTSYCWSRSSSLCRRFGAEEAFKLIQEVCGRSTKSLVFQTCNDDYVLARKLEPEVLSQSDNSSLLCWGERTTCICNRLTLLHKNKSEDILRCITLDFSLSLCTEILKDWGLCNSSFERLQDILLFLGPLPLDVLVCKFAERLT